MKENEFPINYPKVNFERKQKREILTESSYNKARNSTNPFSPKCEQRYTLPNDNEKTYKFYKKNIRRDSSKKMTNQVQNPFLRNSQSSEDSSNYIRNLQKAYEVSNKNPFAVIRYNTEEYLKENMPIDLSSIKSSPNKVAYFFDQISNLKNELATLNDKIKIREERLASRYIENYGLRFTINTLQEQLELIKERNMRKRINRNQCIGCNVF